jgi:hypothetical protein
LESKNYAGICLSAGFRRLMRTTATGPNYTSFSQDGALGVADSYERLAEMIEQRLREAGKPK